MNTKTIALTALLLASGFTSEAAQRQISSFKELKTTYGSEVAIGDEKYSEPDIYYLPQADGTYQAVRLTVSPQSKAADITVPYLNLATHNSICVNWKTSTNADGSVVRYGLTPDDLNLSCEASGKRISSSYFWNTAELTGLQPDTPYYYQVISNGTESKVYRFRTKVVPGSDEKVRILVIGDHQRNEHSDYEWLISAARQTVKEKYGDGPFEDHISFLLNDGDQVDGGYIDLYEKVHLFKSRHISPNLPNMTVVGNHEYRNDDRLSLYDGHYNRYGLIDYKGITSGNSGYYAYQNGAVLVIALNSDNTTAEQKFWVRKVVAAADADETVKFIVSVQHRPLYAEQYTYDVSSWMMNEIMPILSSTPKHVLNIAGHHHLYARGQMTDTPVYHIITGGGVGTTVEGYEQLWGKTPDNRNHAEVQKTIDHWTYQILEFDPTTATMTVECYSIGNSRLAVDNELVDSFSRKVEGAKVPATPLIEAMEAPLSLPATIRQLASNSTFHSVQYQIAQEPTFANPLLDKLLTAEDFYGATADYLPLDINKGINLNEFVINKGDLSNGTYYVRVRNRSANLDWSEYSEPVAFTVEGESDAATLSVPGRFFKTGTDISFDYTGAPVNTDAWIGIYKENFRPGTADLSTEYAYTSAAAGTCNITVRTPGAYFAVLFKDGGYTEITPRVYFVVSDNCDDQTLPSLSTDKLIYEIGEPVVVKLHNAPCIQNDWVGLYDRNVAVVKEGRSHSYAYVGSNPQGSVNLNVSGNYNYTSPVSDGVYYVTYCIDNEYFEPMERSLLIVGKPVIVEPGKATYDTDEDVMITYEGAPGWKDDHMALYCGENHIGNFAMGAEGGTVNLGTQPAGDYEVCAATDKDAEISHRVKFSIKDNSTGLGNVAVNDSDSISVVANGDIRATGSIEVYTLSGQLQAAGTDRVLVTLPGIYVAKAATSAVKLVVK